MPPSRFELARILFVLASALILLACSPEANREPLRIGINPWPGYAFFFLAEEQGFFEEEGANVRLVELTSLGDIRRAFERGQIDGMTCTLIEVLLAREHSHRRPQIVLVSDYSNGPDVILSHDAVASTAELEGKKVGVELSSLGVFVLARALEREGYTLSDVELVPLDQAEMRDAFTQKRVDAIVTYPPVSTLLKRDSQAREIFSSREIPNEIFDVLAMDQTVVEQRTEDVAAILRAWQRAIEFAAKEPEKAHAAIARRARIDVSELVDVLSGLGLVDLPGQRAYFDGRGGLAQKIAFAHETLARVRALENKNVVPSEQLMSDLPLSRVLAPAERSP